MKFAQNLNFRKNSSNWSEICAASLWQIFFALVGFFVIFCEIRNLLCWDTWYDGKFYFLPRKSVGDIKCFHFFAQMPFIFQVNLDADLGSGTNTVIVDADSLSSTHGRTGSSYHGNSVKVDSKFLNKLLSQSYGGRTRQSGNY